ncbi:hypothetical protein G6011_05531 [Alternaria panax]|uniref:Uncharacterized protein n=1 Tax=Alternaria panax TaxID=48097 RepID=A0AAD4FCT5_9PLEO|nr:hypothetical protein G6011_05531 [Alternaria panax]
MAAFGIVTTSIPAKVTKPLAKTEAQTKAKVQDIRSNNETLAAISGLDEEDVKYSQ